MIRMIKGSVCSILVAELQALLAERPTNESAIYKKRLEISCGRCNLRNLFCEDTECEISPKFGHVKPKPSRPPQCNDCDCVYGVSCGCILCPVFGLSDNSEPLIQPVLSNLPPIAVAAIVESKLKDS